ncbi:MAG: FAD-dependent oxidoreductase [Candidatus Omnitrophica bacterium]|jgi:protoporphyrinogen oxidase|nr:FAD-dependent oxidoreductase [Candidatus Omnitrophota bacterium]
MDNYFQNKIVILGAGVTGLTIASELSKKYKDRVLIIEKENFLGGLATTLSENGLLVDLGSHRLHRETPSKIIRYIENTTGEKLLKRPRKGKVYINKKFIAYPPNIFGILGIISIKEAVKFCFSYFKHFISFYHGKADNFEEEMIRKGGKDIYKSFYKDFAEKLWGRNPKDISIDAAKKHRSYGSLLVIIRRLLRFNNYFFYPKQGIGQISSKLADKILNNKGYIAKETSVKKVFLDNNRVSKIEIENSQGERDIIDIDLLISTIPIDKLYSLVFNGKEDNCKLEWRGVRIMYIVVKDPVSDNSETYYFPSLHMILGRVSRLQRYSPYLNPYLKGTLLTIEIPFSLEDKIYNISDSELLELCLKDLIKVGILKSQPEVLKYFSLKLENSYPLYATGWKGNFFYIYNKLEAINNLFTVGRYGLFLHCNIDHCIIQGLKLSQLLLNDKWRNKRLWHKEVDGFLKFSPRD